MFKLLITTQIVDQDSDVLGAFHDWIKELAQHCSQVSVICLYKGKTNLPPNVRVFSLGKEKNTINIKYLAYIKYLWNFYRYLWHLRKDYNNVFVHMNTYPIFLAGLYWRLTKRKIILWKTHPATNNWNIRIALLIVNKVLGASKKAFAFSNHPKFKAVGHGINTDLFQCSK